MNPELSIKKIQLEKKDILLNSDPNILFEDYLDEIQKKSFRTRTEADVEKVVSLGLSGKPITPLNKYEVDFLGDYLRKETSQEIDYVNNTYKRLAQDQIFWIDDDFLKIMKEHPQEYTGVGIGDFCAFFDATSVRFSPRLLRILSDLKARGIGPLDNNQLTEKLNDLTTYTQPTKLIYELPEDNSHDAESLLSNGMRGLYDRIEGYGYANEQAFKDKLDKIKARTNKTSLTMLDIGGNIGEAVRDAKKVDPTLKTINITLNYSPLIIGDVIIHRPAENMPAEFEEKIDLIESNYAFGYFPFPDIALKNAVKALSIGGETNINFSNVRCPLQGLELNERMKNIFSWLAELQKTGYIEIEGVNEFSFVEKNPIRKQLKIIKNKSTIDK